jgi:hypothetical protein
VKRQKKVNSPKICFLDIETAPMLGYIWDLFDQTVGLNQIYKDWHLLSFAYKWADDKKVHYHDQSKCKNIEDDKELLKKLWKVMDDAQIIVGQNVKRFDIRKINARFLANGLPPPSSFRVIDTLSIAKKNFALTSNKLEYMTKKFNKKHKKLDHKKFNGFSLWSECLKGNPEAWKEMKKYNIADITSLEELYYTLAPWDASINFSVYDESSEDRICSCGSKEHVKNGFRFTNTGRFQRFKCLNCGKESQGKINLLSKEKKASLKE